MTHLTYLNISSTQVSDLNITGNNALKYINILDSQLPSDGISFVGSQLVNLGTTGGQFIVPDGTTTDADPWNTLAARFWTFTE
jgi:hypothetical protein